MSILTIDLETYYSQDFGFSKLTTEEYVRGPQWETIGFAYKIDNGPTVWVPKPDVERVLASIDWSDKIVVCQNTAFDGAVLKWHYGVDPMAWVDIMGMSRALYPHERSHSLKAQAERMVAGVKGNEVDNAKGKHYADFTWHELERYGEYCCNDVNLTYDLFMQYMNLGFPKSELKLIDLTLRMFIDPVLILDKPMLVAHLEEVKDRKEALMESVRDFMLKDAEPEYVHTIFSEGMDGIKKLLMSNPKFALVLENYGVVPPTKISATTKKLAYAFAKTDDAFKELMEHPDVRVQMLVAARLGNKTTLEETRTQRFIGMSGRGKFPVPLRYYGAHSGRWSGQDSVNLQNLPSRGADAGKIKKAIRAPEGYVVIDCDSAQIEARVLAWLAGQEDLLQAFRDKQDVYSLMASKIYGIPVEQVTTGAGSQRQVGKTVVLGAGYGVGHVKLKAFLKTQAGVEVTLEEAKRIIDAYRSSAGHIAAFWQRAGNGLTALMQGQSIQVDAIGIVNAIPGAGLTLPNGLHIQYPGLRAHIGDEGKRELVYTSKGLPVRIYGGKCLAGDTQVLTHRGWIPIGSVRQDDQVWDGVEWVQHGGLTYQGEKHTIVVDGVRMTPDHKVLTEKGWRDASACEGLHRAEVRIPDGPALHGVGRSQVAVEVPMPVRGLRNTGSDRHGEVRQAWGTPLVRVHGGGKNPDARNVQTSRILGVEVDARPMPTALTSGMAQLRGAWGYCMRSMATVFRGVLGRHGANLRFGVDVGSTGQQRVVYPGKLPMGVDGGTSDQPQGVTAGGLAESTCGNGYFEIDSRVSLAPEPVYDLLNAGPRTRFMVRGHSEPFVVHNCVENVCQAVARQVVAEQMLRVAKRYKVVLTVHDAIAIIAKKEEAKEAQAYLEECMSWNPKWATGLPLACESGMGESYGDC
jgi:DNA polymerase